MAPISFDSFFDARNPIRGPIANELTDFEKSYKQTVAMTSGSVHLTKTKCNGPPDPPEGHPRSEERRLACSRRHMRATSARSVRSGANGGNGMPPRVPRGARRGRLQESCGAYHAARAPMSAVGFPTLYA